MDNPTQTDTLSRSQKDRSFNNLLSAERGNFLPIIAILVLILVGAGAYHYGKSSTSTTGTFPSPSITQAPTQLTNETVKVLDQNPSPTISTQKVTTLNYSLPAGWKTIQSADGVFEVGYDHNTLRGSASENSFVHLNHISGVGGLAYSFTVRPYNGGSRHESIKNTSGNVVWEKTYEVNYSINGKSALVYYNADASASNIVGVIVIDNKRVISFSGAADQDLTEQILKTLKILK